MIDCCRRALSSLSILDWTARFLVRYVSVCSPAFARFEHVNSLDSQWIDSAAGFVPKNSIESDHLRNECSSEFIAESSCAPSGIPAAKNQCSRAKIKEGCGIALCRGRKGSTLRSFPEGGWGAMYIESAVAQDRVCDTVGSIQRGNTANLWKFIGWKVDSYDW